VGLQAVRHPSREDAAAGGIEIAGLRVRVVRQFGKAWSPLSGAGTKPRVAILMATYNGAAYLEEQLVSLRAQSYPWIDIIVSDDGSQDGTPDILRQWLERWDKGRFVMRHGPGKGFAENFRSLIVDPAIDADYFAFCDQDDIWEPDKLETAVSRLRAFAHGMPALFCSRTLTITENGRAVGASPLFARNPSFRNALVQSLAGGNTMVLNRAALSLVKSASIRSGFVSHDWWAYLLVSGAGGQVFYCSRPLVRYRQHGSNQVGANTSLGARLGRLRRLIEGQFWRWSEENLAGLEANADLLTPDAIQSLVRFREARTAALPRRLFQLVRSGVYRQTLTGNIGLYVAALIKRL
jgi:glycosyltransferase involved in cell wall biosynthesis